MTTQIDLRVGDCVAAMETMEPGSVHAILTDPPYDLTNRTPDVKACEDCGRVLGGSDGKPDACPRCGGTLSRQRSVQGRGFMGKVWDATGVAFDPRTWDAALRVLKPGGHLVAFGSPRTHHRLMVAIEDAGFELRDMLCWLYGTGFPKSLNVSKAIDKAAGVAIEKGDSFNIVGGTSDSNGGSKFRSDHPEYVKPSGVTPDARQWEGWGTALKPAWEPIVLARKPFTGTVAANVMEHSTGALNIDATRLGEEERPLMVRTTTVVAPTAMAGASTGATTSGETTTTGRWAANVVFDSEAAMLLDAEAGDKRAGVAIRHRGVRRDRFGWTAHPEGTPDLGYGDSGGPSRFFYCAKASRGEREFGLDALPEVRRSDGRDKDIENPRLRTTDRRNHHPTVKPMNLMRWLTRLVVPPGATVLDPFLGSGTTGIAVALEDHDARFIGMDLDPEYIEIARTRINAWQTAQADGEVD